MNIILLSGGSGKRLWPLSNDVRSKQFIKLFKNEKGEYESMVQRVYRQITNMINTLTNILNIDLIIFTGKFYKTMDKNAVMSLMGVIFASSFSIWV